MDNSLTPDWYWILDDKFQVARLMPDGTWRLSGVDIEPTTRELLDDGAIIVSRVSPPDTSKKVEWIIP